MKNKILAFACSSRQGSYNQKLINIASKMLEQKGAEITVLDLAKYPLPLFSEELKLEGKSLENLKYLKEAFYNHNALLIASPEYNSFVPPILCNLITWLSIPVGEGESKLQIFDNKVVSIVGASSSYWGGVRGLVHLRSYLSNYMYVTTGYPVAIPEAENAFNSDGNLISQKYIKVLDKNLNELLKIMQKFAK